MPEKINIKSCSVKKQTDSYTIYEITDSEGKKYDSFEKMDEGEVEVIVTPNGNYNPKISKIKDVKGGKFQKDWTFEKRKAALECAVTYASKNTSAESSEVMKVADRFYNWLNQK